MAASLVSKCSHVGRSLLGGLGNNVSGSLGTLHEMMCSNFMSQQLRTFIQMRTVLKVVDNSGAKKVMCIQALKGKKGARLGDTIIASVKEAMPNGKVKKGKVVYGVVVRAAMQRGRCDGSEVMTTLLFWLISKVNQLEREYSGPFHTSSGRKSMSRSLLWHSISPEVPTTCGFSRE